MVIIDPNRCTYCGGCVSVCPVEALTLAETRLLVSAQCIDCGDCVPACPVGALTPRDGPFARAGAPARRNYDLVVVGAGPAGAMAAKTAAEAGLSVLLLEKRQEIGSPVRCAEGVGYDQLLDMMRPDPAWIAAEVNAAVITTVAGGERRVMRGEGGRGYILERRLFDRAMAEEAARAGAEVRVKTAASGLLIEDGRVRGVRIRHSPFYTETTSAEVSAGIVIGADGVEAQVGRWAGLDTQLPLGDAMVCAQYLLAGVEIEPHRTSYFIDYSLAPGGYLWIFPKGEGRANVGLGLQADLAVDGTALTLLNRFVEAQPVLAQGYPVTLVAGNVPVAQPPAALVTDGLMLVGDAARQVDPLTGGGILNGMAAGRLAADVAVEAIAAGDTSAPFLSRYQERWGRSLGRKMARNYRIRVKFPPVQRTDERFVRAFALAAAG
jgi:digeranylgeranylglycerophospholipid reductase